MNALQVLMDEHRVIERAIDALVVYARGVGRGADHPRADLVAFVDFITGYADAHHHGKEEDILFRRMADSGMSTEVGPLAVMLAEHHEGRRLTRVLAELAESDGEWDEEERSRLLKAGIGYAQLLRAHIQKEDGVLYPMAQNMLPEEAREHIEAAFESFQSEAENLQRATRLRESARELAAVYRD
jgi:hemerythrin-like domain-containing protein